MSAERPAPRATVLTAVFNGERHLSRSLDSVLSQDFTDFEFVVVDDGSTDGTSAMLDAVHDERLRVVRNEQNLGLAASLNRGLAAARGGVIIRHDADDVSLPGRFARQMAWLAAHPEVGVCGGQARMVREDGSEAGLYAVPLTHPEIVWEVGFGHPFAHPATAMRTEVLRAVGGYSEGHGPGQDQELWTRLARATRMANLDETLVDYLVHAGMTSGRRGGEQHAGAVAARARFVGEMTGRPVSPRVLGWADVPPPGESLAVDSQAQASDIALCAAAARGFEAALHKDVCTTQAERRAVSVRAGRTLYALGAHASRRSPMLAARLYCAAVARDASLLAPDRVGRAALAALRGLARRRG